MVRSEGADKRTTARFLAFGVNGLSVALMVVVFAHTAGVTGAEAGIAGGSAVLGQKLLEAVFGDQAVRRLAEHAREDLEERVDDAVRRGARALRRGARRAPARPRAAPTRLRSARAAGSTSRSSGPADGAPDERPWSRARSGSSAAAARRSPSGSARWRPPPRSPAGGSTTRWSTGPRPSYDAGRGGWRCPATTRSWRWPARPGRASPRRSTRCPAADRRGRRAAADHLRDDRRSRGAQDDAAELLDWLERAATAPGRRGRPSPELEGLVLLDLPDHDSTEVAHHLEVDRLVQLVDMLVWVLDPQKYADAAVHERYLRPLATHREVMIVVAQPHRRGAARRARGPMLADLRRLLAADGLGGVPVLATSAPARRRASPSSAALVAERVARQEGGRRPGCHADVEPSVARSCQRENGDRRPRRACASADRSELVDAFADAAGVPTVVRAVERSVARRGAQHTGWLVTVAGCPGSSPTRCKRLHLDLGAAGKRADRPRPRVGAGADRACSAPASTPRSARSPTRHRLASSTPPWAAPCAGPRSRGSSDLDDALDRAVVGTDLGVCPDPAVVAGRRLLQVLFALALLAGLLWLRRPGGAGLPPDAGSSTTPERVRPAAAHACCWSSGSAAGSRWLSWAASSTGWSPGRGRAPPSDGCGQRSPTVTDELVLEPVDAELHGVRRGAPGARRSPAR